MPKIDRRALWDALWQKSGGICALCNLPLSSGRVEIDHIIPRIRGGSDDEPNRQLLHKRCNASKGADLMENALMRIATRSSGHHKLRDGQKLVTLQPDPELLRRIEDFQFSHRLPARSVAIRRLIQIGLERVRAEQG